MEYEAFKAQVEREINRIGAMILSGSCPDYVSYRELVAQIKALEAAIEIAKKALSGEEDETED